MKAPTASSPAPIDMVLHCPKCGTQHIDKEEPNDWHDRSQVAWRNPPHRSHLCHYCGHIWRPADVATNGVAAVKTKGKADHALAAPETASSPIGIVQRVSVAGYPMQDSTGVEWLKPVAAGTNLYAAAASSPVALMRQANEQEILNAAWAALPGWARQAGLDADTGADTHPLPLAVAALAQSAPQAERQAVPNTLQVRDALARAIAAMKSVRVFVTTREHINRPTGEDWYDREMAAAVAALAQSASQEPKI